MGGIHYPNVHISFRNNQPECSVVELGDVGTRKQMHDYRHSQTGGVNMRVFSLTDGTHAGEATLLRLVIIVLSEHIYLKESGVHVT